MIKAEIVAHSLSLQGDELISVLCTFPRIILAEVNTHRMLSKNTSSSRAIPLSKMVESVETNPFIPIAWQKEHKGMQGFEYITDKEQLEALEKIWLYSRDEAVRSAKAISSGTFELDLGIKYNYGFKATKQLANRLLEPFMWTTMLITGPRSGWDNFFNLRNPVYELKAGTVINNNSKDLFFKSWEDLVRFMKNNSNNESIINEYENKSLLERLQINKGQAEIHIMDLAEKIYDAVNESKPKELKAGEWHIPFEDKIHIDGIQGIQFTLKDGSTEYHKAKWITKAKVEISTAMAARTSYTVVGEEKDINYQKMIDLHDRLISQDPPHSSPMEHCAQAMSDEQYYTSFRGGMNGFTQYDTPKILDTEYGWCRNFRGFIPYRHIIETKKYGDI